MAPMRRLLLAMVWLCFYAIAQAQVVYYPAGASQLLQSTAEDIAMLLQKSMAGSRFTVQPYNSMPNNGIILIYGAAGSDNQQCIVKSNGSRISFTAPQDNGLCFGVYEYLQQLGFRFYQPGEAWEIIPVLQSPYKITDTVYSCKFKYKNWFISGGCSTWALDTNPNYYWDTYYGEIGHQWALYQRRNNMTGGYRFAGHRDDVMTKDYLSALKSNPCYVAPYNGSRQADGQSVADINNTAAMQLWGASIEKQYTQYKNTIFSNSDVYANYYRNFEYAYGNIGIEVPDGSHFANSNDNSCGNFNYPKESDQHFILANFTASKINAVYPGKRFQLYAYDNHADVPSTTITINKNMDVQVVPTAFQFETSAKGLLSRWYSRNKNISEYHYLNIAQWSGETPSFDLKDLAATIDRIREKQAQGIVLEAAPSKFASLPFLFAANAALKDDASMDDKLKEFCSNMFDKAAGTVYKLLQYWSDDKTVTITGGIQDNKYKLPFYFQLVNQAALETQNAPALVKERVTELKAYLCYMSLYYDWAFDQRPVSSKKDKAAALCSYLAKINTLQIVNSYALINTITGQYQTTDDIYLRYNTANGTAYQHAALTPVTSAEINAGFDAALAAQSSINNFSFKDAAEIKTQFEKNGLAPLEKINVEFRYTYGRDYSARSEFYFIAGKPGSIAIKYDARFDMPGKGYLNFTVEATDKTLGVVKDFSIDQNSSAGIIYVALPYAGTYKLSLVSKYKTTADITITTNGNYFYKNGPFLGNTVENYRNDLASLPGYFYVPEGMDKIFFSLNNSNPGGAGFASPADISKTFEFKDNNGNSAEPLLAGAFDSALFYLPVPKGSDGSFWHADKMEQYRLCFANTSNIQWYATKTPLVPGVPAAGKAQAIIYPNPGTGIFKCMQNRAMILADEITIFSVSGARLANFFNTQQFDISFLPAGMYFYTMTINKVPCKGKIVKL